MKNTDTNAIEIIKTIADTYGFTGELYRRIEEIREQDIETGEHRDATDLDYYLWAADECAMNANTN